jgi:hypothetical protein
MRGHLLEQLWITLRDGSGYNREIKNCASGDGGSCEGPEHHVPFDSREGGYQYGDDGPYDAEDVLREEFPYASEQAIADAVNWLEREAMSGFARRPPKTRGMRISDPLLTPVHSVLAAQTIRPQARTLAEDHGIRYVTLDYDKMRGIEPEGTLF